MTIVSLDRNFLEWREGADSDVLRWRFAQSDDLLAWSDLLARRRVVVLAEAGSGKTVELDQQARQLSAEGKFAVYATVQDVGRQGLDGALRAVDRERLSAWRTNDQPGWFFVDSIDEAKLDNIRLDKALRELANGIFGHEGRAFVVLSGRHTDWEFTRDARRLHAELPIPAEPEEQASLRTLVRRALNYEKRPDPKPIETPLVVLMAPLNDEQMRRYAAAKGVSGIDDFLAAIRAGNLQKFARRPLDLVWLVRYWVEHGCLGSFRSIIEASLRERLRETDPDRDRLGGLSTEGALRGLERIGAAMVLGRRATIAIPDAEAPPPVEQDVLSIDTVLLDWTSGDRQALLSRPALDPATFGRARLHNDNEGVVRAFLAARWLARMRQANLPARRLQTMLFAETYGIDLVRPSLQEAAAWLSLTDDGVAREVVRRAPFLLFTAGDPSSLPTGTRAAALQALAASMRADEETPMLDQSSLARFAQADIVPTLRRLWHSDAQHAEVRALVLRLIWLGALRDCADLAVEGVYGSFGDRTTQLMAGRALIAAGSSDQRKAYAALVRDQAGSLPPAVVWDAVQDLFPNEIAVDDLLAICEVVSLKDDGLGGFNMEWAGAELAERLSERDALTRLLRGLMELGGGEVAQDEEADTHRRKAIGPMLAAAADRLLSLAAADEAPEAAIDAVLYLGDRRNNYTSRRRVKTKDAVARLHETPARRCAAFWRVAERLAGNEILGGRGLQATFQMQFLGWPPGLVVEDIDWLLVDGPARATVDEQRLAANAALEQWARANRPDALMRRIADAATPAMRAVIDDWLRPPEKSAELLRSEAEHQAVLAEGEKHGAEVEQSWVDFVEGLRSDSAPLRDIKPPSAEGVDSRLYHLWQLLREANRGGSQYAIESVAPLAELVGASAAAAFVDAMKSFWRAWKPTVRSSRPPSERNQMFEFDSIGVAAVSIEAVNDTNWATKLTAEQATRAAQYATLEINGLPRWIGSLSKAWPAAVQRVMTIEVASELDDGDREAYGRTLDYIDHADEGIASLVAETLWPELASRPKIAPRALRALLSVLRKGMAASQRQEAFGLAIERFRTIADPEEAALYLGLASAIDGHGATDALVEKLAGLGEDEKTALVQWVLPQYFGSRRSVGPGSAVSLELSTLERLVILAYRTVRVEDDHDRANRGVYSPDARDDAQDARSAAFNQLVRTPGRGTFDAIQRLLALGDFPAPASRLRALSHERAMSDSELPAWAPGDAYRFEREFERTPETGRELQLLAIQRLRDLEHDLLHADFAQGATVSGLPDEAAVQAWIADRMRLSQGQSYSIEREPQTVAEKKPDMVFTARTSAAKVPAEIKVAGSWSVTELEAAITQQLCGQYLRSRDCREGLLVLVHQKPRTKGWPSANGRVLTFVELVQRLDELTARIKQQSSDGPQPELVVIDVSSCAPPRLRISAHRGRHFRLIVDGISA